jgi:hypothetical protein
MRHVAPAPARTAALALACLVVLAACDRKDGKSDIDIPTAQTRAALSLSAFECSHLATTQADTSRLFNVGLQAGRDFLGFAETNANGYRSLVPQLDPAWVQVENRPSVDFKLGELHAITVARAMAWRRGLRDSAWEARRETLYQEKNCQFLDLPTSSRR